MSDSALQQKLEALLKRKQLLEAKLGTTRANEAGNTRKNDAKYQVSSTRAVQARAKKGDKAMLRTVNMMIQRVRTQLAKKQQQ